jgi:hypothetical protein
MKTVLIGRNHDARLESSFVQLRKIEARGGPAADYKRRLTNIRLE